MSLTYLALNLFIIAVPLWYTTDERTAYYRRLPSVLFSIAVVSTCYLVWDSMVTARGEWSFNSRYLTGVQLINIPLEEVLFFITVPYSCLFIYEVVLYATTSSSFRLPASGVIGSIVVLMAASLAVYPQAVRSAADQEQTVLDVAGDLLRTLLYHQHRPDGVAGRPVQQPGNLGIASRYYSD